MDETVDLVLLQKEGGRNVSSSAVKHFQQQGVQLRTGKAIGQQFGDMGNSQLAGNISYYLFFHVYQYN